MLNLVVVENPDRWPLELSGVEVVSARDYVGAARYSALRGAKVFNLCRRFGYQTLGYYVSLLATARGHRPMPSVATLQDLRLNPILRIAAEEGDSTIQRTLRELKSDGFDLSIYFGRNMARRYDRLCGTLFNQFPAPLLRAEFSQRGGSWKLDRVRPIGTSEIPDSHRPFVIEQASRYFDRPRRVIRKQSGRFDLAILVNEEEGDSAPSDSVALQRFVRAARKLEIDAELIGPEDFGRIGEYDALFIRETTAVNHHTYRFSRRASAERLVVIDDPESILRCSNKVYQAELFSRLGIPTPKTLIVSDRSRSEAETEIGFPCVLKRPDSSFSRGVMRVDSAAELKTKLDQILEDTELAVVQEFAPSEFDWRVGILNGRVLYVCKYYMARDHWQILSTSRSGKLIAGRVETLAVEDAPPSVVRLALRATKPIGNGLYGVDIKEVRGRLMIMEVNDNPTIESDVEDRVLKDDLYSAVMQVFLDRLERRSGRSSP